MFSNFKREKNICSIKWWWWVRGEEGDPAFTEEIHHGKIHFLCSVKEDEEGERNFNDLFNENY